MTKQGTWFALLTRVSDTTYTSLDMSDPREVSRTRRVGTPEITSPTRRLDGGTAGWRGGHGRAVCSPLDAQHVRYCAPLGAWSAHVVRDRESVTAFKFLRGLTDDNATTVGRQQDRK